MATVFLDKNGVLIIKFMQQGTAMPEVGVGGGGREREREQRAIQNKTCGMLASGVVLLHDNAHPNRPAHTRALLEHFNWELFDHPPYSPDVTPSDYHPFTYLKNWL
jgi:hypothetical protein